MPIALSAQDISGWRAPTTSELSDDFAWRKENANLYLKAKADFDGDGKEDEASLLINDKENKMGLFVTLFSQGKKSILLETIKDKKNIIGMGIKSAKSGKYKTACGKGYWDCKKGEPAELNLRMPAMDLFQYESANSFFVWDSKIKKFKRIWMSD
jgi:hypothetical protein